MVIIQNLLWLSDFFKMPDISSFVITKLILPQLHYLNVLPFLEDAYLKLTSEQSEEQNS